VIASWVYRASGRAAGVLLALVPFVLALYFAGFIAAGKSGGVFSFVYYWAPSRGSNFLFFSTDSACFLHRGANVFDFVVE
jgi:hypothetical protein